MPGVLIRRERYRAQRRYTGRGDTQGEEIHRERRYTGKGDTQGEEIHRERRYTGRGDTQGEEIHRERGPCEDRGRAYSHAATMKRTPMPAGHY